MEGAIGAKYSISLSNLPSKSSTSKDSRFDGVLRLLISFVAPNTPPIV